MANKTVWTDPSLTPRKTTVKTTHIEELRRAVNNLEDTATGDLDMYKSGRDASGVYTVIEYKRKAGTTFMKSTLSSLVNNVYTRCTWQFYDDAGVEKALEATTWVLTYDSSNIVTQATGNSSRSRTINILEVLVYHGVSVTSSGLIKSATEPSNPSEGMLWYNSSNNKITMYINGAWKSLGGGISVILENTVVLDTASASVNIGIPGFNAARDILFVIKNTTDLTKGEDYTATDSAITRVGGATWEAGARFTFRTIQGADSDASKLQVVVLGSTFTATTTTNVALVNQPLFAKDRDVLYVYFEGARLFEGDHYTINSDGTQITLNGWSLTPNAKLKFEVWKNVATAYAGFDAANLLNGTVSTLKIADGAVTLGKLSDYSIDETKLTVAFLAKLEKVAAKDKPNGYAGLDANGCIATTALPSGSAKVFQFSVSGSANTYTANVPEITSLYDGLCVMIKIPATNTGASTLAINSLGAKPLLATDVSALKAGAIATGYWFTFVYNSGMAGFVMTSTSCNVVDVNSTQTFYNKTAYNFAMTGTPTVNGNYLPTATNGNITLYVDCNIGSDGNNGLSSGAPLATIQAAIDKIPQIVNHPVTVNVVAGTYNETVTINGFSGKGRIDVLGATTATNTHVVTAFTVYKCYIGIKIEGFRCINTSGSAIYATFCACPINISKCVVDTASASYGGIVFDSSVTGWAQGCVVSNRVYGYFCAYMSQMMISTAAGGVNNTNGIVASGGIVRKLSGVMPLASSMMELIQEGGCIFNADGSVSNVGIVSSTTANVVLYVDAANGNDANVGTSSGSGAKKTIMAAISSLPKYIDHTVTINVAAGTYPEYVHLDGFVGDGSISLKGDTVTSTSRSIQIVTVSGCNCYIELQGFNITGRENGSNLVLVYRSPSVNLYYINMVNAAGYTSVNGIYSYAGSSLFAQNCTVSNTMVAIRAQQVGNIYIDTVTGTGNTYAYYAYSGKISLGSNTTVSGTNPRYSGNGGLIIDYDGAIATSGNTNYTTRQHRNIILSTGDPTGGENGDVWIKYTP